MPRPASINISVVPICVVMGKYSAMCPLGSPQFTGFPAAYPYRFTSTGFQVSSAHVSRLRKRPTAGSYSRARREYCAVVAS